MESVLFLAFLAFRRFLLVIHIKSFEMVNVLLIILLSRLQQQLILILGNPLRMESTLLDFFLFHFIYPLSVLDTPLLDVLIVESLESFFRSG